MTTVTQTGLSLTPGQTYFFSVRAVNTVGLTGSAANSNGQVAGISDTTPPSAPGIVRDGTTSTDAVWCSATQVSANWDASTDNESGMSGYMYAVGTTAGATDTINWTALGNVTTVTKTGLSLVTGQTYFFSVYAVNAAGLTSNATNSNGQTVDGTAPTAPANVRDGLYTDISITNSTNTLSANWDASTDPESGMSGYQYAIGTTAGGTNTVNWTSLGNVTTVTKTGLTLTAGTTYFFSVRAVNTITPALTGAATNSNGQKAGTTDATAPSAPPAVRDGTGADISTTGSTTQLSANWDASTDNETGISGYQYAIGTTAGATDTVAWTSLGNVTTVTKTGLTLAIGQTYFFSVKAVNGAGLTGAATNSDGQKVVDTTAPSPPPAVRDGTGADISTTSSLTQLSANWDVSTDNETGISGYQYAIGTTTGATDTVAWTSLGNVTTVTKTGLSLAIGQTYFFSVKAVNGAGLTGAATNSNGQTALPPPPPPIVPAVRDGTGADIATTASTTQLSANWDAANDPESGISGYQYAIGTSAGGTQTVNWTSLGNVTTVTQTGLSLVVGQTYYFSVKAVNGVGLTGTATSSNGQTVVDMTPPTVTSAVVNGANGAGTQRSMVKSLVVNFSRVVTLDTDAFTIVNKATLASVTVAVSADNSSGYTVATLTFSGDQTQSGSLIDGNYKLTVDATKVHDSTTGTNLDGDNDGQPGGNYVFGAVTGDKFFRLFGDCNGSRGVDGFDFAYFASSMNKKLTDAGYLWYFDYNNSNKVDGTDFAYFAVQMGKRM